MTFLIFLTMPLNTSKNFKTSPKLPKPSVILYFPTPFPYHRPWKGVPLALLAISRILDKERYTVKIYAPFLQNNSINKPLISQLIRSSCSIGANYLEADGAESKKDFKHKISICKKEAKETRHWIRMLSYANPERKEDCRILWKEAQELTLIFSAIFKKSN